MNLPGLILALALALHPVLLLRAAPAAAAPLAPTSCSAACCAAECACGTDCGCIAEAPAVPAPHQSPLPAPRTTDLRAPLPAGTGPIIAVIPHQPPAPAPAAAALVGPPRLSCHSASARLCIWTT